MTTYIKFFTTIIFVFISFIYCLGQDLMINTQTLMDAFDPSTTELNGNLFLNGNNLSDPIVDLSNLSNLTTIAGNFRIKGNGSLMNLDGLSNLTTVNGFLYINSNGLTNIDGLSGLTSIGGYLNIETNNALLNIDGLSNLTSVTYVNIYKNDALTNLDGLSGLTSVTYLEIRSNANLIDIGGLSNLTSIAQYLNIEDQASLMNLDGLSSLASIGGYVRIIDNSSLTNLDGLSNLTSTGSYVNILDNDALIHLDGLSSLTSINGYLNIRENDVLIHLNGLSNLTSIGSYLTIRKNVGLIHLDGLVNLTSIGSNVAILDNNALIHLDGLSNLTSLDGTLSIYDNISLTNLDGLSNLISIDGSLSINSNSNLTDCCGVHNLLNILGGVSGTININNNPSGCSSENEIINATCGLSIKIFNDLSQDCINDNDEAGIANRQFIIQPGDIIGETNIGGRWYLDTLPLGDYTVTIDTSGTWSPTCPVTQSFTIIDPFEESILPTFGLVSTAPCAAPDISIYMPFMRPCFENQRISIQACNRNNATGVLENAFVIVELDSLLIPTSSSIPYIDLGNHMYQFDIGTLNPGFCTSLWMKTTLSCEAELGQGLCMEAQLFPAADCVFDDIPNPFPSGISACDTEWDLSSLEVEGYCQNDSIFFEVTNNGSGDMTCFNPVNVYINGNLIIMDSVQLISGETAFFAFSTDGQSWWLEVAQHPLHPGNSQPNAIVEGCGESIATFSSYVNAMALDDADPVVDIYCGTVTGSYDPNDKTGFPLGVNESNDILPNQKMEYLIRFQNTGTDTAFTVVIRDTLSTDFDIFSVESGVGSHPYEFTMYGSRIMEWTFNNILLPDSTTSEIESHGFIKFTVDQIPNLSEGTVLENNAGIYFDFNDPIITNTSQHTINYFTPEDITTTNISETACGNYTSPSGNVWTNTGTYYDVSETENSIVIVDLLIVESIDATIQPGIDYTITANIPNAEYQWLNCDNNSMPISGATNQNFTPTETGNYAVQITQNDCVSVSDCYNSVITGINNSAFASLFNIYPNPTKDNVFVNFNTVHKELKITLRNVLGQIIFMENVNNASEYSFNIKEPAGLYFLEIEAKDGESAIFKILKD